MKQKIFIAFLLFSLFIPAFIFASHTQSHTLQQLMERLQGLQTQLQTVFQQQNQQQSLDSARDRQQQTGSNQITRWLTIGSRGQEVTNLQTVLAQDRTIYPEGEVSGYFGALTQTAVQRFQCKYNIMCSGTPLTTGYGATGPKTRAKLNEARGTQSGITPVITSPPIAPPPPPLASAQSDASSFKQRKARMLTLAKEDPQEFLNQVLSPAQIAALPLDIQQEVEKPVSVTGRLEIFHADDFQNKKATYEYFLRTASERLSLHPTKDIPFRAAGSRISIQGYRLEREVVFKAEKPFLQVVAAAAISPPLGEQRILNVPINFSDSPPQPFTREQARQLIFEGQIQRYFKEASYQKISLGGEVLDWLRLLRQGSAPAGGCWWPGFTWDDTLKELRFEPEIENYFIANNIDLGNYQQVAFYPNHSWCGGGMGGFGNRIWYRGNVYTLGMAWVGALQEYSNPSAWGASHPFSWTNFDFIFSHEFGHALTLPHANSLDCEAGSILYGTECQHIEYGNFYDVMDSALFSIHFNAHFKESLNWLDPASVETITASGRYTIKPLTDNSGKRAAKIGLPGSSEFPFYLEYRKPIGFDGNLSKSDLVLNTQGLMINWVQSQDLGVVTRLLDMTPVASRFAAGESDDWEHVVLNPGAGVFRDEGRGITVGPIINADAGGVTFDVSFGQAICVRSNPTSPASFPQIGIPPGATHGFGSHFNNNDTLPCGPSDFKLEINEPADWQFILPQPISVAPQKTGNISFEIKVPQSTALGTYQIPVLIVNLNTGGKTTLFTINVIVKASSSVDLKVAQMFDSTESKATDGPLSVSQGSSYVLKWTSQNVERCASGGDGPNVWPASDRPLSGSHTFNNVQGIGITNYVLQCVTAGNKQIEDKVQVIVTQPPTASWTQITKDGARTSVLNNKSGHFEIIDNFIYALGGDGAIYKWNKSISDINSLSGAWESVAGGGGTDVFQKWSDGKFYILGGNGAVYRWDGQWTQITRDGARSTDNFGKSGHFEIVDGFIYALGGDGAVYRWPIGLTTSPNPNASWDKATGDGGTDVFKRTSDGKYYILGQNGAIYRWDGQWTQITREGLRTTTNSQKSGHFQFFSENEIYGLGGNGLIYRWTAGQNPNAQWEGPITAAGEINDVFYLTATKDIYGLGLNGAVYRWGFQGVGLESPRTQLLANITKAFEKLLKDFNTFLKEYQR